MKQTVCRIQARVADACVPVSVTIGEFEYYLSSLEKLGYVLLHNEIQYGVFTRIEYYVADKKHQKNYVGVRYIYDFKEGK